MRTVVEIAFGRRRANPGGGRFKAMLAAVLFGLFALSGSAVAQPTSEVRACVPDEPVQAEVRAVLAQYGRFVQHARYGEVWVPTVTPQGGSLSALPLGQDEAIWLVLRRQDAVGSDRSSLRPLVSISRSVGPGIQVLSSAPDGSCGGPARNGWAGRRCRRTSRSRTPRRIGSTTATSGFSSRPRSSTTAASRPDGSGRTGSGAVAPDQMGHRGRYVGGIVVIVLPPYVIGPIVIINTGFDPWPAWYMVQMMIDFKFAWQKTLDFNVAHVCTPSKPN